LRCESCHPAADALYIAANAGDPHLRIEQLTALIAAINDLANLLDKQFADTAKWTGPKTTDYKISTEIAPTFDKMQTVTVKVTTITLKVDTNTEALLIDQQAASSVAFDVRKYGAFTPEIGAGAVFEQSQCRNTEQEPTVWVKQSSLAFLPVLSR